MNKFNGQKKDKKNHEGRYLWANPSFDGEHIKLNGFTTTANLGLRF